MSLKAAPDGNMHDVCVFAGGGGEGCFNLIPIFQTLPPPLKKI